MNRKATLTCAGAATLLTMLAAVGCDRNDGAPAQASATSSAQGVGRIIERTSDSAGDAVDSGPVETTPTGRPKRRDGWWELASFHEDGAAPRDSQSLCVGAGLEDDYNLFEQMTMFSECSLKDLSRAGAGWRFETRCDIGMNIISESKGTISGNFHDRFRVDQTVLVDGTTRSGSVRGEWKGACPAAYKPGDLVDHDGKVLLNLLQ